MTIAAIRLPALFLLACIFAGFASEVIRAQESQQVVFHVLHIEESAVYIDIGRNLELQEGTKLSLFHAESAAGSSGAGPSSTARPIAELKVLIVADSSAVCEILNSPEEVRIGDIGFVTSARKSQRPEDDGLIQAKDHPISLGFSDGDPRDDNAPQPNGGRFASPQSGHAGFRIGLDYDGTQVQGGFRASEAGLQISSDMTKFAGTNWNFTGYWRSRFRETYSGLNGEQLESLADRIDRTYHIGFYYESPTSPIIAGFGRLSVPGAPSLPTIDGGYFGRKITRHVTLGIFGGSTPDPTDWSYNPDQGIAGIFTILDAGDFSGLHFGGTEGVALTAVKWRAARQFAFVENTISWKRYLWLFNSTEIDAARTSPVPGAGSNNTGISFTSSSLRVQPIPLLSVGLNHSYFDSLPSFDPDLLGTTLLDKYIFQGLSVDARFELPHRISLFTQVGRSKSIADAKGMWNKMYGVSFGNILKSGFHADLRYSQFASTFGQGNYWAVSASRSLKDALQIDLVAGSQNLVSDSTTNTASHFLTRIGHMEPGPTLFLRNGIYLEQRDHDEL